MTNIAVKNLQKKLRFSDKISRNIGKLLRFCLTLKKEKKSSEITVCIVDNRRIKRLNQKYHNSNQPTDVITFDLSRDNKEDIFTDIIISAEMALSNAKFYKTSPFYELYLYAAHGILHLLGYNDKTKEQRKIMDKKAKYILNRVLSIEY